MNPYDRTLRQPAPVIPGPAKKARADTGSGSLGTKIRRYRAKANPRGSEDRWVVSDDARNALERCELFSDVSKAQMMEVAALVEEVRVGRSTERWTSAVAGGEAGSATGPPSQHATERLRKGRPPLPRPDGDYGPNGPPSRRIMRSILRWPLADVICRIIFCI